MTALPHATGPEPDDAARAATDGATSGGVQSVDRSLTILELLGASGGATVVQLATELGVHKSTASRLLSALEAHDMVTQNGERGKYRLGFGILRLAHAIPGRLSLVQEAASELRRLAQEHRETVNLAVLREGWVVNVAQEIGPGALGAYNWIGNLTPVHATSSGKVLLAGLPSAQRMDLLRAKGVPSFTSRTITSRKKLEEQLLTVAAQGYATVFEEWEIGLNAVGVPVRNHLGDVVAALSISGPAFRFTPETMNDLTEDLQSAGRTVSRRLGWGNA